MSSDQQTNNRQAQPAPDSVDPLVSDSFGPWLGLLWQTLRRSWRALLLIIVLTITLPSVVFGAIGRHIASDGGFEDLGHEQLFTAVVAVVTSYAGALAWAAAIWTLVRQAVAAPARFRDAIAYASRNGVRMWGWLMLYRLMVGLGVAVWLLPGLYLLLSFGLLVPLALLEPGSRALHTSFRMINRNLGAALARLSLVYVLSFVVLALAIGSSIWQVKTGVIVSQSVRSVGTESLAIRTLLQIPAEMVLIVGVLLTYAHLRAKTRPTTSMDLAEALAAPPYLT